MSLYPETVEALVCLRSWYKAGLVGEVDVVKHYEDDVDYASDRAIKHPTLQVLHKYENLICVEVGLLLLQRLMEKRTSSC
ncbi:hypothetical protein OUZ56_029697 [Daphnia magna]|uniref:HAT C-terminal dimerisation domain-containing protein n=1 Tax=Daphnia magna TaxID=35525 RepID=A0ABR0B7L6_9CRUS|nr:hypothetical protein OUZ56_029697 [Daphnia magna]